MTLNPDTASTPGGGGDTSFMPMLQPPGPEGSIHGAPAVVGKTGTQGVQAPPQITQDQLVQLKAQSAALRATTDDTLTFLSTAIGFAKEYTAANLSTLDPANPLIPKIQASLNKAQELEQQMLPSSVSDATTQVYVKNESSTVTEKTATDQIQYVMDALRTGKVNLLGATELLREINIEHKKGLKSIDDDTDTEISGTSSNNDRSTRVRDDDDSGDISGPDGAINAGNAWLGAVVWVTLMEVYMEVAKMKKLQQQVEVKIEAISAGITMDMAENTAAFIMAKAEVEKQQHIVNAFANGLALGMTVVLTGAMAYTAGKMQNPYSTKMTEVKPPPGSPPGTQSTFVPAKGADRFETNLELKMKNDVYDKRFAMMQAGTTGIQQMSGMVTNLNDAYAATAKAGYDAGVEMMRARKEIIQTQSFQRALEVWKESAEEIQRLYSEVLQQIKATKEAVNKGWSR